MNKEIIIQILMIFLIIIISWLFFSKYIQKDIKNNAQKTLIKKKTDIKKNKSSNYIENINYTSVDLKGNKYQIEAEQAEIDINEEDIMFLENVVAHIYLIDSDTIKITSDFGKYNSKNYDTIFTKNVIITYPSHRITGEYLDFSFLSNLGTMSIDVFYTGDKTTLIADRIEIDISTKDTKIFMDENNKKVLIEGVK